LHSKESPSSSDPPFDHTLTKKGKSKFEVGRFSEYIRTGEAIDSIVEDGETADLRGVVAMIGFVLGKHRLSFVRIGLVLEPRVGRVEPLGSFWEGEALWVARAVGFVLEAGLSEIGFVLDGSRDRLASRLGSSRYVDISCVGFVLFEALSGRLYIRIS
jgi:hypothetical protein